MADTAEAKGENSSEQTEHIPVKDELVVSQHKATINGQEIEYTVTCGTILLKEEVDKQGDGKGESEGEKPKASLFFIAYTRDGVEDLTRRPLTFSFNGGPGSSSVWLHMGLLGPRRVEMDETGNSLPPPYRMVNNDYSLLDQTDLVFIDPVSTGYSRVVTGETAKRFHGFKKDIESVGDFIRLYVTRSKRWMSPKFLIGESYGTTRAAGLSGYLQERHNLYLNGIMLVSSVLNFQTVMFSPGNDLPYVLFLPTYAATAWYHNRLPGERPADLVKFLQEVEAFALGEYSQALMKNAALTGDERAQIVSKLAGYTGLSPEYIDQTNLRIQIHRFVKELLREERTTVGRLDSRFIGYDHDAAGELHEYDPSLTNILGTYTAVFNHYVRAELNYENDLPYEILNPRVWPWSYSDHENRYVEVSETLRKAMTINPYLKVQIGAGYFDLATPYFASIYTANQMALEPHIRENLSMAYYQAGHMMYIHRPSLIQQKEDLARFIEGAV
jgi:carboxypeptidase C (cathepsin A)